MGLFDSKSKSSSNQTATEQGQQVEDQGNAFNFSGVVNGKKNQAHINVTTSDFGAITASLENVDNAIDLADSATTHALEFGAGAFTAAIDSANDSRTESLEFGAGAFTAAIDSVNESSALAISAANASAAAVSASAAASMVASTEARRDALEFGAGTFSAALESVDDAAELAVSTAAAAYSASTGQLKHFAQTAIDKVSDATRSEASTAIELLMKITAGVAALGVLAYAIRGR